MFSSNKQRKFEKKVVRKKEEDSGNMELVAVSKKMRKMFPILRVTGHKNSEITGPSFTEDFTRLYFSSQRGRDGKHGITYEVRGPFTSIL